MKAKWDLSYSLWRYCTWEIGVTIHGFKLFLVQYLGSGVGLAGKELVIYLLGAGVTLRWRRKGR